MNYDFNSFEDLDNSKINLNSFFEKVKILSNLEKVRNETSQMEQDIEFLKSLKPLLSERLQAKLVEAVKMLPFFEIMPIFKKNDML